MKTGGLESTTERPVSSRQTMYNLTSDRNCESDGNHQALEGICIQ